MIQNPCYAGTYQMVKRKSTIWNFLQLRARKINVITAHNYPFS